MSPHTRQLYATIQVRKGERVTYTCKSDEDRQQDATEYRVLYLYRGLGKERGWGPWPVRELRKTFARMMSASKAEGREGWGRVSTTTINDQQSMVSNLGRMECGENANARCIASVESR